MQREVDYHTNIIKFYGISILEMNSNNHYLLVMEYADGGSLQSYLKENFNKLEWSDKYKLSFQLANAVACMHKEGIIHCDLVIRHNNLIKYFRFNYDHLISTNKCFYYFI